MALGDYEKTVYKNGQAPGLSANNLNKNEDKTEELDTAVKTHGENTTIHITSNERTAWNAQATKAEFDAHLADYATFKENAIKIKTNITVLATNWVDDTATSGFWKYDIPDADITVNTVVDVNIRLADLAKAEKLKSANLSSDGKVTIYADEKPAENIICDLKLVRQVS